MSQPADVSTASPALSPIPINRKYPPVSLIMINSQPPLPNNAELLRARPSRPLAIAASCSALSLLTDSEAISGNPSDDRIMAWVTPCTRSTNPLISQPKSTGFSMALSVLIRAILLYHDEQPAHRRRSHRDHSSTAPVRSRDRPGWAQLRQRQQTRACSGERAEVSRVVSCSRPLPFAADSPQRR